jgi:hypothetical protein
MPTEYEDILTNFPTYTHSKSTYPLQSRSYTPNEAPSFNEKFAIDAYSTVNTTCVGTYKLVILHTECIYVMSTIPSIHDKLYP